MAPTPFQRMRAASLPGGRDSGVPVVGRAAGKMGPTYPLALPPWSLAPRAGLETGASPRSPTLSGPRGPGFREPWKPRATPNDGVRRHGVLSPRLSG